MPNVDKVLSCDFCGDECKAKNRTVIESNGFKYVLCRQCMDIHKIVTMCEYTEVDTPMGGDVTKDE